MSVAAMVVPRVWAFYFGWRGWVYEPRCVVFASRRHSERIETGKSDIVKARRVNEKRSINCTNLHRALPPVVPKLQSSPNGPSALILSLFRVFSWL
jgi:hypothetical protein